jgi:hypothetical protein
LRDKAKAWLKAEPAGIYRTWEEFSFQFCSFQFCLVLLSSSIKSSFELFSFQFTLQEH